MDVQVSKVSPKPLSVTPTGPVQPRSSSEVVNHSWATMEVGEELDGAEGDV